MFVFSFIESQIYSVHQLIPTLAHQFPRMIPNRRIKVIKTLGKGMRITDKLISDHELVNTGGKKSS